MRLLALPFWNFDERRLRALLRMILALAIPIVLARMIFDVGKKLLMMPPAWLGAVEPVIEEHAIHARERNFEATFGDASLSMVTTLMVVFVVWAAARYLDRRPLDDLGLRIDRSFWIDAVFGFALGGVLMGGILGAEVVFGWATYQQAGEVGDVPHAAYAAVSLFTFLSVAINEELVFRGYQMTNLAEGLESRWFRPAVAVFLAMSITSALFGLAHADNPNATLGSTGNIVLAGMWLALGYVLTGRLAIPLGIHFSWNFFQNLFGMPVSGQDRFFVSSVLTRTASGPEWITGGPFGPEGGMTGLAAMAIGTALTLAWVRFRYGALRIDAAIARFRPSGSQ